MIDLHRQWQIAEQTFKPVPQATLLKDADPDIPILQQAEAEYAKLK